MDNIKGIRTADGREKSSIRIVKDSKVIDGFIEIIYQDGRKELVNKNSIYSIICDTSELKKKPEKDPEQIPGEEAEQE